MRTISSFGTCGSRMHAPEPGMKTNRVHPCFIAQSAQHCFEESTARAGLVTCCVALLTERSMPCSYWHSSLSAVRLKCRSGGAVGGRPGGDGGGNGHVKSSRPTTSVLSSPMAMRQSQGRTTARPQHRVRRAPRAAKGGICLLASLLAAQMKCRLCFQLLHNSNTRTTVPRTSPRPPQHRQKSPLSCSRHTCGALHGVRALSRNHGCPYSLCSLFLLLALL